MDTIQIRGGKPLYGEIKISGAKNAALPLMAASLLSSGTLSLSNLPHLVDIATMSHLLAELGVKISMNGTAENGGHMGRVFDISANNIHQTTAPYDLVSKMRASVLVLGPLVARTGQARVSMPGGCAIGTRPIDLHLKALQQLGAEIELDSGYVNVKAKGGLKANEVIFPMVTVGGTENIMMAATLADGKTIISNAAREPEIVDLAQCLIAMGANIKGAGSDTITIYGVEELGSASHHVLPDRIETATYAAAAAITGGKLTLRDTKKELISSVAKILLEAGVKVADLGDGIEITSADSKLIGTDIMTEPYPGFPTDMQAQLMSLMTIANGASMITETIFENRFMHVPELCRMGADINVHGASAIIRGVSQLSGARVMATDLRASVSLVLAGLAARGVTTISRVYHLDRGYERLEEKLSNCGASIQRLSE